MFDSMIILYTALVRAVIGGTIEADPHHVLLQTRKAEVRKTTHELRAVQGAIKSSVSNFEQPKEQQHAPGRHDFSADVAEILASSESDVEQSEEQQPDESDAALTPRFAKLEAQVTK